MSLEKIVRKHRFMDDYAQTWYGKILTFPIYIADHTIKPSIDKLIDFGLKYHLFQEYKGKPINRT